MSATPSIEIGRAAAPNVHLLHAIILLLVATDYLQSGMVAFAAGPIMAEIGASPEQFSLVIAAYASVAIIVISQQRWVVERVGWRMYVAVSLVVFSIGAGICASSHSLGQFFAGRIVMGLGGASFVTASRVMINLLPAGPGRFKGVWYYATGLSAGSAAAPYVASVAIIDATWSDCFVVLIVLAVITGIACSLYLPRVLVPQEKTGTSIGLIVVLAGASFVLLFVFQRSSYDFFSKGAWLAGLVLASCIALIAVIRALAAQARPFIKVRGLLQTRFLSGLLLYTCCYVILGASNYALPMLLQRGLGFPWQVIGRYESLAFIPALVGWWTTARVLKRWPAAGKFYLIGFGALAFFGWRLSGLSPDASFDRQVFPALAANGIFMSMILVMAAIHTFKDVQSDDALFAHAQQVKNMVSQLGIASGSALAAVGLQWRIAHHYASLNMNFVVGNDAFAGTLAASTAQWAQQVGANAASQLALAQAAQALLQQSTLLATFDYFIGVMLIGLLGAAIMTVQKTLK